MKDRLCFILKTITWHLTFFVFAIHEYIQIWDEIRLMKVHLTDFLNVVQTPRENSYGSLFSVSDFNLKRRYTRLLDRNNQTAKAGGRIVTTTTSTSSSWTKQVQRELLPHSSTEIRNRYFPNTCLLRTCWVKWILTFRM